MLKRSHIIALFTGLIAVSAPAFADGTGKGPVYNAPAPLTPQSTTIYHNPAPISHSGHSATCHSTCGQTSGLSHSGLATNPHQNCCGHASAPVYHAPAPAPIYHAPAPIVHAPIQQGMIVDISGFSGGVGVGVHDAFVGFGGGAVGGSNFGLRSSGFFAGRNANLQRSIGGFRGARGGGFRGGRGGFRGGRRGGGGRK